MIPSLTDTLCTRCALCCEGSLFADVELSGPKEAAGLEIVGLKIEDDDGWKTTFPALHGVAGDPVRDLYASPGELPNV